MYLWIYTNGILGSKEMYEKLTNAGLDEIRFDIGASNYDLKYIKLVKNSISNISVEIPAVPEELEQLKQILPELIEIGVTNLNLHQLRLTNYNAPKILQKNYTCLHGEQATILESELTALKIIEFVADNNLKIGVNYCAFHFKNRFQKAGFRKRIASKFTEPNLQLTDNGFLRSISNNGSLYIIENNKLISENNELTENHQHFEIKYRGLILDDKPDNTQYLKKIIIGSKTYFLKSGPTQTAVKADQNQIFKFLKLFDNNGSVIPEDKDLFALWKNEFIEWNLREYF
jgi:pyruvate formate-lyase activating enzyme-like uncharacterized protein